MVALMASTRSLHHASTAAVRVRDAGGGGCGLYVPFSHDGVPVAATGGVTGSEGGCVFVLGFEMPADATLRRGDAVVDDVIGAAGVCDNDGPVGVGRV